MEPLPFPNLLELADRLQWARARTGLPATACGVRAGLSHGALPMLESGASRTMDATTAFRLARVMARPSEDWAVLARWLVCGHQDPLDLPVTQKGRRPEGPPKRVVRGRLID